MVSLHPAAGPGIEGGLLFLEDVDESPHRVDRLLHQLYYAGVLGRQKALILGAFNSPGTDSMDPGFTVGGRAREGGKPCPSGQGGRALSFSTLQSAPCASENKA